MTNEQLYHQAEQEWTHSKGIQRQYPTFVFYWHEHYERVYNISYKKIISQKCDWSLVKTNQHNTTQH